jgi:hypothetical protein
MDRKAVGVAQGAAVKAEQTAGKTAVTAVMEAVRALCRQYKQQPGLRWRNHVELPATTTWSS